MSAVKRSESGQRESRDAATGRFLPGNSLGGRPPSAAKAIRQLSDDGTGLEVVRLQLGLVRTAEKVRRKIERGKKTEAGERVALCEGRRAAKDLTDQLFGRARQVLQLDDGVPKELEEMPEADFRAALAEHIAGTPEFLQLVQTKAAEREKAAQHPEEH